MKSFNFRIRKYIYFSTDLKLSSLSLNDLHFAEFEGLVKGEFYFLLIIIYRNWERIKF